MTGTLAHLVMATIAFVGAHIVLSSRPIRDSIVAQIGARPFLAFYSAAVALPFVWMIAAYIHAPYVELWIAPTGATGFPAPVPRWWYAARPCP